MSSTSAERGSLVGAGEARNRALLVGAAAMFVLLLVVEIVTLRTWVVSRDATDDLADRMSHVGQLANIQREVGQLRFKAENVDEFVTEDELLAQRAIVENQVRRLEGSWVESNPELLEEFLAEWDRVKGWFDEGGQRIPDGDEADAIAIMTELEIASKRLYDSAETPYFQAADTALTDRNRSNGLLLLSTGLLGLFAVVAVITARRSARAQRDEAFDALAATEARHRTVLDSVKDVIFTTDRSGNWTFLSQAWERLTGHGVEASLGLDFLESVHPADRDDCAALFRQVFEHGVPASHEVRCLRANGDPVWVEVWVGPDEEGGGTYGTLVDITSRREFQDQLHHQATTDSLTGLPNRPMLSTHLDDVVERSRRTGRLAGILFLDLDRFKLVNDGLGHDIGDRVLTQVATRISAVLDERGLVGRLGGDEFVVIVEDLGDDRESTLAAAGVISETIEAAIKEAVVVGNDRATITASVGITTSRTDARADELLAEADAAMYRAKEQGKAGHAAFDERLRADADHRLHLEHALRGAQAGAQLVLVYQPILDLGTDRFIGTEALLRWDHPTRGIIGPDEFLAVAEEAGVMTEIGEWVIRSACADASWMRSRRGVPADFGVAVNLSVTELCSADLIGVVESALDDAGLEPEALCVEVTEHDVVDARTIAIDNLHSLRRLGVRVSMDDFGTGYSSLAYLRNLPVDELKIDRAFIERLTEGPDDPIVRAVSDLGSSMGLVTVAEGVETAEQLTLLRLLGVDRVQGNHVAEPASRDQVVGSRFGEPVSSVRGRA